MSVLEKIDNFLMEDNKAAGKIAAGKFKKLPKKFGQVIKEQDEDYAEDLFSKMAAFISQVDVSDLPDELVLLRNEIIGEIYPGEDDPFDDDDFTGEDSEADDAEDLAGDEVDADFGDEADEEDFYERRKLRGSLLDSASYPGSPGMVKKMKKQWSDDKKKIHVMIAKLKKEGGKEAQIASLHKKLEDIRKKEDAFAPSYEGPD